MVTRSAHNSVVTLVRREQPAFMFPKDTETSDLYHSGLKGKMCASSDSSARARQMSC